MLARLYQGCSLACSVLTRGKQTPVLHVGEIEKQAPENRQARLAELAILAAWFPCAASRSSASRQILLALL